MASSYIKCASCLLNFVFYAILFVSRRRFMKKKGIFGGTFDPILNGHLHVAYEALYNLKLDEIIFIPSGNPPHKTNKIVTDAKIRYGLVKMVVKDEKKFKVSDYEIKKNGLSYTYETLEFFNKLEPNTQWYFITGADCLMEIYTWKNIDAIFNSCKFVVFNRSGYKKEDILKQKSEVESKFDKEIIFLDIPILEISSTLIRSKIKEGKNISYLVPKNLNETLKKMNVYR